MISAVSSALFNFMRPVPASPCWPMPISISSSPSSKIGCPVEGCVAVCTATASVRMLRSMRSAISRQASSEAPCSAAAPATLYTGRKPTSPRRSSGFGAAGDVLVRENHLHIQSFTLRHIHGDVGRHHVAGVVQHDKQNTARALGRGQPESLHAAGRARARRRFRPPR